MDVLENTERSGEPSGRTRWRYGVKVSLVQREWLQAQARSEGVTVERVTTRLLAAALAAAGCHSEPLLKPQT